MSSKKFIDYWRDAVWDDDELTAHERLVLFAYAKFADYDTGSNVRPGQSRVGRLCKLSRQTVGTLTNSVVERGWMVCTRKGTLPKKGQPRIASEYQLTFPTSEASYLFRTGLASLATPTSQAAHPDWSSSLTPPSLPSIETSPPRTSEVGALVEQGEDDNDCPTCEGTGRGFSAGYCPSCRTVAAA